MTDTSHSLSPLHIFRGVQEYVKKINTTPLVPGIIKVNKDQVGLFGDEQDMEFPFARIDTGFAETYDDLVFVVDFYEQGVGVSFSGGDYGQATYESLGSNNDEVAKAITNLLTAFSNGQIRVLLTCLEDNEHIQAIEILYRKPHQMLYDAIGTFNMFMPSRKLNNRTLVTTLFANHASIEDVDLDVAITQTLVLGGVDAKVMSGISRKGIVDLSVPLTPQLLKQNIDNYSDKVGQQVAEKIEKKLTTFEESIGTSQMTLREMFVHYARWRHIELMASSLALVAVCQLEGWPPTGIHPVLPALGVALTLFFIFREKYPYPRILYILAPLAYVFFTYSAVVFLQDTAANWLAWVVAVLTVLSFVENVFFDGYYTFRKFKGKYK